MEIISKQGCQAKRCLAITLLSLSLFPLQLFAQFTTTPQTINAIGGVSGSGDLKLIVDGNAKVNIWYDGREQTYAGKGLVLQTRFYKDGLVQAAALSSCSVAPSEGSGTAGSPWKVLSTATITSPFDPSRKYTVNYTISYSNTWSYFLMDYEVIGPALPPNGESLNFYLLEDTRISGGDCGSGYIFPTGPNPQIVGVYRHTYTATCNGGNEPPILYPVAHCLKASTLGFSSYFTGAYDGLPSTITTTVLPSGGVNLSNIVNGTISVDNQMACHLNFGTFGNSEVKTRRVANCYGDNKDNWNSLSVIDPTVSAAGSTPISVEFVAGTCQGNEGDVSHAITGVSVRVSGGILTVPMSVKMVVDNGGTATTNDFEYQNAFTIPAGIYTTPVVLPINNITIKGNANIENNRTILLRLASCGGFVNIGSQATTTYTILDDDCDKYSLSVSPNPVDAGATATATIALNAGTSIASGISLNVSLNRDVSSTAVSGTHFNATLPASFTLNSGTSSRTFSIPTISGVGSSTLNLTATASLAGSTSSCTPTSKQQSLSIISRNITFTVNKTTIEEGGGAATGIATITASLDGADLAPSNIAIPISFTGTTATVGTDYTSSATGTLTILSGQHSATMTITALADNLLEGDETVVVTASPVGVYSINTTGNPVTITIKDMTPGDIVVEKVNDGSEPITPGKFRIRFKNASVSCTRPVKITYSYSGTAVGGTDYNQNVPAEATIPAAQNGVDVLVPVINNFKVEGSRSVILTLLTAVKL